MPPGNEPLSPSHLPDFGLAAMLTTRSITTNRSGRLIRGIVRGSVMRPLVQSLEASPSASWLHGDATNLKWSCRVQGPIEHRDRAAIRTAIARGDDPLEFEIRGDVFLTEDDHGISFSSDQEDIVLSLAGALLRSHAAEALRQPTESLALPTPGVVAAVIAKTGLALRGLETEVFPGFLDIGISDADHEGAAASRSLILDRVTGSWHTD
ncbi:MAG: hypothetical protein GY876_01575 [Planctomycetes bacterium]|nr:hypothetical protein [Planctomycetota bacterium]